MILIRINCPDDDVARAIAEAAVDRRFAACANIAPPVRSVYRWQGAIETASETVLYLKTTDARFDACADLVRGLHPDDTPAILAIPVTRAPTDFTDWLEAETAAD